MNAIPPVVRHVLICREVRQSRDHPMAADIIGMTGMLQSTGEPTFPFHAPPFGVFVLVTNGRGEGDCVVRIRHADTGLVVHEVNESRVFAQNPLALRGLFFAIPNCVFPRSGLYMVQFRFDDSLLAQEPLLVR